MSLSTQKPCKQRRQVTEAAELGIFDSIEDVLVDADGHPMGYGRPTDCMHLGTILKRIRQLRGDPGQPAGWQDGTVMYVGFLWERAIELAFKAIGLERPGVEGQVRLRLDGICGTLDGVDWSTAPAILIEYKATYKSMRRIQDPELTLAQALDRNFPDWTLQVSGYLKMLSVKLGYPVLEVHLYVLFLRGDYAKDLAPGPRVRVLAVRFTEQEIDETWQMFRRVKEEIEKEVGSGQEVRS